MNNYLFIECILSNFVIYPASYSFIFLILLFYFNFIISVIYLFIFIYSPLYFAFYSTYPDDNTFGGNEI